MQKNKKSIEPLTIILGLMIIVIFAFVLFHNRPKTEDSSNASSTNLNASMADPAVINAEKASANLIKAVLTVYYLSNFNSYPVTIDQLLEQVQRNPNGTYSNTNIEAVKGSIDRLKDFDYSPRGDDQAYQFTYTSANGKKITETGNYKEDYH